MTFALLTRERADFFVDRYTEHKEREPERLKDVAVDIGFVKRPMGVSSTVRPPVMALPGPAEQEHASEMAQTPARRLQSRRLSKHRSDHRSLVWCGCDHPFSKDSVRPLPGDAAGALLFRRSNTHPRLCRHRIALVRTRRPTSRVRCGC